MAEVEKAVREIPIDQNLPAEVQKLADEGWVIDPEHPPKAVYHIMRQAQPVPDPGDMQVRMQIDESKIGVMRDGKIIG